MYSGKGECAAKMRRWGAFLTTKKDPRLLEGDDYALSLFLVIFAETRFFRSFDFGACTFTQNDVSASHPTVYFLLSNKLRDAFVLGHGLHDAPHFPFLLFETAAEEGHKHFHEHFAVIDGTVHLFFVDGHRDFAALHEHVGHEAELVVCKFRHDCFRNSEAIDDGVPWRELRILFVGGAQEAGVEVGVVGEQDGARAAEGGELLERFTYWRCVFDHFVGNVVHVGGFGGNEHVGLYERVKFRDEFRDHAPVFHLYSELYGANFNDFVLAVYKTSRF